MLSSIAAEKMDKAALRKGIRRRLAACAPEEKNERDRRLTLQFLSLPQVARAEAVLLYCGVGLEVNTRPLTEALWGMGKAVAMPRCLDRFQMEARRVSCWDDLAPGRYGIPEPKETCPEVKRERLDLILVPALACDREGYRLGQGAGYYDRYLSGFQGDTAALCGDLTLLDRLPREAHDLPVSLIVTESGVLSWR